MLRHAPLLVLSLILAACGGGGGGGSTSNVPLQTTYFVDVATGADQNAGTPSAPLNTITEALSRVMPGDTVYVRSGQYMQSAGESYPLVVPEGVRLTNWTLGEQPELIGGAMVDPQDAQNITACVVLRDGARLESFKIVNELASFITGFHYGVLSVGEQVSMERLVLTGSENGGIRVAKGTIKSINDCEIFGHTNGIGLHFAGSSAGGAVRRSEIYGNKYGIEYDSPGPALGSAVSPVIANAIYGNAHTDLWVLPGITVQARYNLWNHGPPTTTTQSNTGGGVDVFDISGGADVDVTGGALYVP